MSGGLAALLDDIALLAKMAAASVDDVAAASARASVKAAGVVVDDTAVTPQYVHGVSPARELPIIKKIALGSLRNKLLFILPGALALSQFLPWLLTPLLMLGGAYLCFEGAEKILALLRPAHDAPAVETGDEDSLVAGAVRTDFILSAEIMVIALGEVASEPFLTRAVTLAVVAVFITLLVYGVVAVIVKMDDVGLHLATKPRTRRTGRALVQAMPYVLKALSGIGMVAMLWVGGHILLDGLHKLGWHAPLNLAHEAAHAVPHLLSWPVETLLSALAGLLAGALIVGAAHLAGHGKH
ncbi:DUF808 domain-containing protein [Dermabacteraceae bacterium P13264]